MPTLESNIWDMQTERPPAPPPRSLPIATTFCEAVLPLFDGLSFYLDGNSKITRGNGTYASPRPNAFSLPAASVPDAYPHATPRACPGSTPTCRESCYVKGLAQHAPALYARYKQNAEALTACLSTPRGFSWSALKLGMWVEENAPHGFRWHVSGDVLSLEHAEWIASVCDVACDTPFWIYTRTLGAVGVLKSALNLAVNVSADADNYAEARAIALEHGARLCYLTTGEHDWTPFHENAPRHCPRCDSYDTTDLARSCIPTDLPAGSVIFPDYALRGRNLAVPTDAPWWQGLSQTHRAAVCGTDFFGQSEAHRCGPCVKCF